MIFYFVFFLEVSNENKQSSATTHHSSSYTLIGKVTKTKLRGSHKKGTAGLMQKLKKQRWQKNNCLNTNHKMNKAKYKNPKQKQRSSQLASPHLFHFPMWRPTLCSTYCFFASSNFWMSFLRPPFLKPWQWAAGAPTVTTSYVCSGKTNKDVLKAQQEVRTITARFVF